MYKKISLLFLISPLMITSCQNDEVIGELENAKEVIRTRSLSVSDSTIGSSYSFEKSNTQQVVYGSKSTITRRITDNSLTVFADNHIRQ